ncbi:uncharacterized protein GIQ15_01736 [Arthroderma uncinatum]|uniref:uncharacterized protein n=1 Tax=Arthroderma uncinatum TaxID=74035 RepID=UPI00144AE32D|nr:uncharacterized protein GIQ15_01736 [Arthroderma uncinatum]KAF3492219.1 hypothetical protein GIQ15_01736 [Arthroderma uncinatum]
MKTTIPSDVWETKRSQISNLYTEEEWPLKQVMKKIRTENFNPTETQLRSRLKKWGVTKPSRQRRKRPASRPADHGAASLSQAQDIELRGRVNEHYIPQFIPYPPSCGSSAHPNIWDPRMRWIIAPPHDHSNLPKIVPSYDSRRASTTSNVSPTEGPSPPSTGYHHHHHPAHPFDRQYPTASHAQDASTSTEGCPITVFTGINPNLTTSSGDVTPTSDVASSGLPAEWQSPDSTHQAGRTPGSTLPSPAIQPTSPWNYPTPDMCQKCSPTICPLDDSTIEQQVNYVKEYLDSDDSLSYPSLMDFPLNDAEILDSHSMKNWKRPCSSSEGTAEFSRLGGLSPSRERRILKAKATGTSGPCTAVTTPSTLATITSSLPYPKMESPGPLDLSTVGGSPGSIGLAAHQAYHTDAINNEYLLPSTILS